MTRRRRDGFPTQSLSLWRRHTRDIADALSRGPHRSPPGALRRSPCRAGAGAGGQHLLLAPLRHRRGALQGFTEATGIRVNRIEGTPDELIARMKAEGANSPADIILTVDAGRIWLADREGLLQPVDPPCSRSASRSTCATPRATGSASRSARG